MNDKSLNEKTSLERKDGMYELKDSVGDIRCPLCGEEKGFHLKKTVYNLPDGDDVLILLMECSNCNYNNRDIVDLYSSFKPGVYTLTIDDGDLTHKIFRGKKGNIIIDEIGIEIERGDGAFFEYTNVEGILARIEQRVSGFINSMDEECEELNNAKKAYDKLTLCMKGELSFTLVLKDNVGGSYIAANNKDKLVFTPNQ